MKILGYDQYAVKMTLGEEPSGILRRQPSCGALIVLENRVRRDAFQFEVSAHDAWFVIALLPVCAADENEGEVSLAIKIDGVIEPSLQCGGWRSVEFNLATKDYREIGRVKIVVEAVNHNEKRTEQEEKCENAPNTGSTNEAHHGLS
jgi:hypothetical protein